MALKEVSGEFGPDKRDLTAEDAIDLVLGLYFHSDPEKRRYLAALDRNDAILLKVIFVKTVTDVTDLVFFTKNLLQDAFEKGLVQQ